MASNKSNKSKSRGKNRFLLWPMTVAVLLLLAGWWWLNAEMNRPRAHTAQDRIVSIAPGTNTPRILAQLQREGIFESVWPVRLWLRTLGRGQKLKAGDYRFASPISARQVIDRLARGQVTTRSVTIPEGYNRYDIARVLAGLEGLKQPPPANPEALLDQTALIADLDGEAKNLEGYLFPDTYEYTTSTTREQLVEAMVKRFRQVFNDEMRQRASQMRLTVRQVVTLASLIEKEAKVDRERELISQVFHRRWKEGIPLACDPTVIYAALLANKYRGKIYQSDLDRESPYNTYRRAGLPPGPIASPGRRSLEATLSPAPTDYLFFVVDATKNDGSHVFSARSADHESAVRKLRESERK